MQGLESMQWAVYVGHVNCWTGAQGRELARQGMAGSMGEREGKERDDAAGAEGGMRWTQQLPQGPIAEPSAENFRFLLPWKQ
jgi:hypothetical protein